MLVISGFYWNNEPFPEGEDDFYLEVECEKFGINFQIVHPINKFSKPAQSACWFMTQNDFNLLRLAHPLWTFDYRDLKTGAEYAQR